MPNTIVSGVSLKVAPGEAIAIVGESGSGKTMTARSLIGLLPQGIHASGRILFDGVDVLALSRPELRNLRGSGIAMLFQDPFTMLNPLLPVRAHVEETLAPERDRPLSTASRQAQARSRLAEVGIPDATVGARYPFQLSGGMRQRVGIAAALARNCRLFIADEPTTALDVTTQKEILSLIKSLQRSRGMALLLITHNLRVAFAMADRVYVMYAGSILEVGVPSRLEARPMHPYTLGLLLSEPPVEFRLREQTAISGSVPRADEVAYICPFAPRCRWALEQCNSAKPALVPINGSHASACVRVAEIEPAMAEVRRLGSVGDTTADAPKPSRRVVDVVDLSKTFKVGGGRGATEMAALANVDLSLDTNEVVALVGESGSGKTTLGRCLVGLEVPTGGRVVIDGVEASDWDRLDRATRNRLRRSIQMVFQDPYSTLNPSLTVGETLGEALTVAAGNKRSQSRARAIELLERVGLPSAYLGRKPVVLSGGERQRVAIARALAVEPKILVCDEPLSALDVSVQAQVLNLFGSLVRDLGISMLFITHDLAVARQIATRVYVLYRGRVVESGTAADILDTPRDPYTIRLINSIPRQGARWLEGQPTAPAN